MSAPLIWLHEEALRATHPIFTVAPAGTRAICVWDDDYFQRAGYSLKRLIFVYETCCELPVDIIHGSTVEVITNSSPSVLYIPATNNPLLMDIVVSLTALVPVQRVADESFAAIKTQAKCLRFFQYWNQAKKTAFLTNGGADA